MAAREWKPSSRSRELIDTLIEAFSAGDKWVRFENPATARYTGLSLVHNGIAEFDPAAMRVGYGMRIRLSRSWAAANGWTCWQDARDEFAQDAA